MRLKDNISYLSLFLLAVFILVFHALEFVECKIKGGQYGRVDFNFFYDCYKPLEAVDE